MQATSEEATSLAEPPSEVQAEVGVTGETSAAPVASSSDSLFAGFPFSKGQEVINARAAMAGFVAAIVSEVVTQKSVWVQIAGRCVVHS